MLSKELRKKIRQIQIRTSQMVSSSFAGQYESVFKGRGMQFDQVREYVVGDDIRSIDWNVTARTGKAHIKQFIEEREMTVMFLVDLSSSGDFGTRGRFKNELAAEFCAVLAFAAIDNNDKAGLMIFTDEIELFIPPAKGSRHVLRLIRELLCFESRNRGTNVSMAIDYIGRVMKKTMTVFVISDFLDVNIDAVKSSLSALNSHHDTIAVSVKDPAEQCFPDSGLVELTDAETGGKILVDASSRAFQRSYCSNAVIRQQQLETVFRSTGVDCINIETSRPYINDLIKFFNMRQRRY